MAWGLSLWFVTLHCLFEYESQTLAGLNVVVISPVARQRPPPQEAEQGSLWKAGETSEQLALEKMKSRSPIIALRPTKEERLLWVIPGCMNNEKKLSKGHVS